MVGLDEPSQISNIMKTKTPEEVEKYIKVFKKKIDEFPKGDKIMARINKSESEKNKNNENQSIIDEYFNILTENEEDFCDIFSKIKIVYKDYKSKKSINNNKEFFNEEEDKYLLCLLFKYGYRNWNPIKFHILTDPFMKFNINMKMKTEQELTDRSNYLINCLKLEIKRIKEKKAQLLKEKEIQAKNKQKSKLRKKNDKTIKNIINLKKVNGHYELDTDEEEIEEEKNKKKKEVKKSKSRKKKIGQK